MNSRRRADLQRKLSMGAVPRPPADLSDRIKADIPQYLQAEADRARFSASVAFSMRVAASILLLITTAFVTLRVLEPPAEVPATFAAEPPAVDRHRDAPAGVIVAQRQPIGEEVRIDIAQQSAATPASPTTPRPTASLQIAERSRDEREEKQDAKANDFGFSTEVDDVPGNAGAAASAGRMESAAAPPAASPGRAMEELTVQPDADAASVARPAQLADATAKISRSARAPAPAPPMVGAPPPMPAPAESIRVQASAPALRKDAYASKSSLQQKPEVFGISVDPSVFLNIKAALRNGQRPPASSVNVDALVNYFAGPPARAPRRGVALEVEASPAPIEADGDHAVLRFTVDTPRMDVRPRASTPPAAVDARVEIEIDAKAVASFRRIGSNSPIVAESTLLHNLSVTGLYQLELRPHLSEKQRVATIRLRYRSVTDGKEHVITRVVHGSDLARDWRRATRRHRLASLGAVWGESLKGTAVRADVVRRAEELATQEPADSRARELAYAASATGGDRN